MLNWLSKINGQTQDLQTPVSAEDTSIELPFSCEQSRGVAVPNRQKILRQLRQTCQRQLEILRQALNLNSAVLLWTDPSTREVHVYASASRFTQLLPGPHALGIGVTGLLKERHEIALAPLGDLSPTIPYYSTNAGVGSFMAVKLPVPVSLGSQKDGLGMLCVDRESIASWSEPEGIQIRDTAEQLAAEVAMARQLFVYDRDRHAYRRAFDGLRKLNTALGLESTYEATAAAVKIIVPADFIAISLVEGEHHRIVYVQGDNEELLAGKTFPIDQDLVGQVIKYRRTLPDSADYSGKSLVFSAAQLFTDYRSLLVVPLCQEDVSAIGALIVAAKKPEMFTLTCREMLELVATQVTIKIGLAQAHDQINRFATLDALTGIANRRAYQRGFEAMLERAKRREGSLHLVLCDIDHFKKINDSFGHPFGDEVLQQVAGLLDSVIRTGDLAARTGGEEFAILLEDTDAKGAWKVAERLRELVAGLSMSAGGKSAPVTLSLGIAVFPQDGDSMERLVSCADQALYQAKNSGRNRTIVWTDSIRKDSDKE